MGILFNTCTQNPYTHTHTKCLTKYHNNIQPAHTYMSSSLRSLYSCHISGNKVGSPLDGGVPTDRHTVMHQRSGRFSLLRISITACLLGGIILPLLEKFQKGVRGYPVLFWGWHSFVYTNLEMSFFVYTFV